MSLLVPDPAAPGTIPAEQLAKVHELHAGVRKWIEASAVVQRNDHLRANLPYVDLMFAFGFATLGDHDSANKLVEDARKVLAVSIPEGGSALADQAVTAALVRNFLFKLFQYRIEQALAGKRLSGSLSPELHYERDAIATRGGVGSVNNPYKLALFVSDRFRAEFRIAEPDEAVDPYSEWTKHGDLLKRAIAELHTISDSVALAERIRKLHHEGISGRNFAEARFYVVLEALGLARLEESFAIALLGWVPDVACGAFGRPKEQVYLAPSRAKLLQRAITLVATLRRGDIVQTLLDTFCTVLAGSSEESKPRVVSMVAPVTIRSLKNFNLHTEMERFVTTCEAAVLNDIPIAMWRDRATKQLERWGGLLESLLHLVPGSLHLHRAEQANAMLVLAREELLDADSRRLLPKEYTEVARAYVSALGQAEQGLEGISELFRSMNPKKINNTWTTAQFYSRFHLQLVEDTVFAVCNYCLDNPLPLTVTA